MTALSWADLTYVLPATSLGYVLLALVARFVLHEHVSPLRWLGIVLITGGVGFVAGGPSLTEHHPAHPNAEPADERRACHRERLARISDESHREKSIRCAARRAIIVSRDRATGSCVLCDAIIARSARILIGAPLG